MSKEIWFPISKTIWAWEAEPEGFGYYAQRQGLFSFIRPRIVRWIKVADSVSQSGLVPVPKGWRIEVEDPQFRRPSLQQDKETPHAPPRSL